MAINDQAYALWIANVSRPGGAENIYLDDADVPKYNADPDGFAAAHYGLSKLEYIEWVSCDGAPLCRHRTKTGDLCRNMTGRVQMKAADWRGRHRQFYCASHDPARRKPSATDSPSVVP